MLAKEDVRSISITGQHGVQRGTKQGGDISKTSNTLVRESHAFEGWYKGLMSTGVSMLRRSMPTGVTKVHVDRAYA